MNKELKYILLIMTIFIAAAIETDIFLPAFPDMITYFNATESSIQQLLTWNFFGICASGPLYGPISDAFGRKKPLIAALAIFLVGSIFTVFAHTFDQMLWGRVLQGIGSGGCFTLGTAIIFDAFKAEKAVRAMNQINAVIPFIMAAAPLIGGFLNHLYGFHSNFAFITLLVVLSLGICLFQFDESLPEEKRTPFELRKIAGNFKRAFTCLPFWQMTVIMSLIHAGYLVFLSGSAVLFVLELGVSKAAMPLFQATILGAWLAASFVLNPALTNWGARRVKTVGSALMLVGGVGLAIAVLLTPQNPYWITAGMLLYAFGANWTQSLYFPEGMETLPDIKGVTASLLTSLRLLIVALIIGLASVLYDATIYPIAAIIGGVIVMILATIFFYERRKQGATEPTEAGIISH